MMGGIADSHEDRTAPELLSPPRELQKHSTREEGTEILQVLFSGCGA